MPCPPITRKTFKIYACSFGLVVSEAGCSTSLLIYATTETHLDLTSSFWKGQVLRISSFLSPVE